MGKVCALLIGIDDYPPGTSSLEGCVADIGDVAYLHYSGHSGRSKPAPAFLKFDRDDHDKVLAYR